MGSGSSGTVTRNRGGGIRPGDIRSTTDMLSARNASNQDMIDSFMAASQSMNEEYGDSGVITQFVIADINPRSAAIAYYDAGGNIGLNKTFLNSQAMEDAYSDCVKSGFHPNNGNKSAGEAVAAHEFGHALTDAVGAKMGVSGIDNAADRIVKEAKTQTSHRGVVQMASKISRYATTSNAEAVAEAVCDVHCNGSRAKAESKAIVGVINKYLK